MRNRGFQGRQGGQLSSQPPGTQNETWQRLETKRAKRLRTDMGARLKMDTDQANGGHGAESRPAQEGQGRGPQAGTWIQGPESPEGPQVASKPEFAERSVSRFPG